MVSLLKVLSVKAENNIKNLLREFATSRYDNLSFVEFKIQGDLLHLLVKGKTVWSIHKDLAKHFNINLCRKMLADMMGMGVLASGRPIHVVLYIGPETCWKMGLEQLNRIRKDWPGNTKMGDKVLLTYSILL